MKNVPKTQGILYVVATPIGHRDDISLRAIQTLKDVDVILTEDTRHSQPLLKALGIQNQLISLHAHNEASKSKSIISLLLSGQSCALISDAGTPLINDPGYPLVRQARAAGLQVVPIPGPCALITALSAAGVPCDIFTFCGFLPAKPHARRQKLSELAHIDHTLVFYESTHRILACLDDIIETFGIDCEIVLAKELTKCFEHFINGTGSEIKTWLLSESAHTNGEFVLIIPTRPVKKNITPTHQLLSVLLAELPLKQAVKIACQMTDTPKNEIYSLALLLSESK